MSKGMKYCKQHGKFDDCAAKGDQAEQKGNPELMEKAYQAKPKPGEAGFMGHAIKNAHKRHRAALMRLKDDGVNHKVSKGDDGINHYTGTPSKPKQPAPDWQGLEMGHREFDGTPMMGRAKGAAAISADEKGGKSGTTKPVTGSAIKEQIPGHGKKKLVKKSLDSHEAFLGDISKASGQLNNKNWSSGRATAAGLAPGWHGAIAGKPGKKLRSFGNEFAGSQVGGLAGSSVGGAIGSLGGEKGAIAGAIGGSVAGQVAGGIEGAKRSARKGYLQKLPKKN